MSEEQITQLLDTPVEPTETIRSLEQQVEELKAEVAAAIRQHETDISLIGATLIEKATEEQWCPKYDRTVETLNESLGVKLPVRDRNYPVSVRVTYDVTIYVQAPDAETAADKAGEDNVALYDQIDRHYTIPEIEVTYVGNPE